MDHAKKPAKRGVKGAVKRAVAVKTRQPLYRRVASGLVLVSWGCTKLAVSRLTGPILHQFARLNVPAIVGLLTLQLRRGKAGFLPMEMQAVLASLYAAVALGVTKIKRPGNDKFPDAYLDHIRGNLHLA